MADTKTNRTKLEQGRAEFAYKCAENAKSNLADKAKEYKAYSKKLPMLVKTNGLGAAMAFIYSKGSKNGVVEVSKAYGRLYNDLEDWLLQDEKKLVSFEKTKLVKKLTELDSATYRAITIEVLAFLGWLRRFTDGLIEGEADPSKN